MRLPAAGDRSDLGPSGQVHLGSSEHSTGLLTAIRPEPKREIPNDNVPLRASTLAQVAAGSRMTKPRVCLLYTGGTIGMVRNELGLLRPPATPTEFLNHLQRLAPELSERFDLTFVPIMNKDSTEVTANDWQVMSTAIHDRLADGYDGFVVIHGTDTMHFSASAVSFALGGHLDRPVVFTGAQTSMEVLHGDARTNLVRAVAVATSDVAEVVIVFGDGIYRGCRSQKRHESRFDAFESPAFPPLGYIADEIVLSEAAVRRPIEKHDPSCSKVVGEFATGVLALLLVPGLEPEIVREVMETDACRAVILQSFGAGNVPSDLLRVIVRATNLHKPVLITSQFAANSTLHSPYEPGHAAVEAGAIATGNMTTACAVAKLRWVLARVDRKIAQMKLLESERIALVHKEMGTVFVGEMDEPRRQDESTGGWKSVQLWPSQ